MRTTRGRAIPIIALSLSLCEPSLAQTARPSFRVVAGGDTILTLDQPRTDGLLLIFHRYPDGLLISVRKTPVTVIQPLSNSTEIGARRDRSQTLSMSISEQVLVTGAVPGLQPGEMIELGVTGAPSRITAGESSALGPGSTKYVPRPGEGLPGKALFNPNREYRPEWDSTLVPGYSMPFSNSRDDYVEGRTLAYPPGSGFQQGPGYPPVVIHDGTEAPRVLSRSGGWSPPLVGASTNPPTTADRGSDVPHVPDVHDVPHAGYDPSLPPPGQNPSPRRN
jgi:hypothetical protein